MFSNSFGALRGNTFVPQYASENNAFGLMTLTFACDDSVVGALVGRKWTRVKNMSYAFRLEFPGFDIDVSHRDGVFSAIIPMIDGAEAFVVNTFGEEIAVANHGIYVRSEFVGRIIGSGGHNLRAIEAGVTVLDGCHDCKCTVYYEHEHFYVRFPWDTPVSQRKDAVEYIKARIYEYADYLEERLSDAASTISDVSSQYLSDFSESSVASSVASSVYTDGGDWPELSA